MIGHKSFGNISTIWYLKIISIAKILNYSVFSNDYCSHLLLTAASDGEISACSSSFYLNYIFVFLYKMSKLKISKVTKTFIVINFVNLDDLNPLINMNIYTVQ